MRINTLFFWGAVTMLGGCSLTGGENNDYLTSRNGPDLVIPHPLTTQNISHFYDLPPQNQDPRVSIKPPTS